MEILNFFSGKFSFRRNVKNINKIQMVEHKFQEEFICLQSVLMETLS